MRSVIQRVSRAAVRVNQQVVDEIDRGICVLLGIAQNDDLATGKRHIERLLNYRIFPDEKGQMNLSLRDVAGGLLLISQFTVVADTSKGRRPSFTPAQTPQQAHDLFDQLVNHARNCHQPVASGVFAADMQIELINDGPVTFILEN